MADVRVEGPAVECGAEILTPEALAFAHPDLVATCAEVLELDRLDDARRLFEQVALADEFPDFLTLPAYELID